MTVAEAYAKCRAIAQREAKNFYHAFRVLPREKGDAMCAVYAFMRKADDLSDDESVPVARRRTLMAEWTEAWRAARSSGDTDDPVFIALNDAQRRYQIPDALLEDLVRGTTLDLAETPAGSRVIYMQTSLGERAVHLYDNFAELEDYCYLVASVVGLVCIRIFGYTDPEAEVLAEDVGIAFQLTNILRDVKEDAQRGRIYLPFDWLGSYFHVTPERIFAVAEGREQPGEHDRKLIERATHNVLPFYLSAEKLLPRIDRDSRAALWVLVMVYFELLKEILRRKGDVYSERVSVPAWKKSAILVAGVLKACWYRVIG